MSVITIKQDNKSLMKFQRNKIVKYFFLIFLICLTIHIFGGFLHLMEKDFQEEFKYPYKMDPNCNLLQTISEMKNRSNNNFLYKVEGNKNSCNTPVKLMFLVKSSPENFERRNMIRMTWGSIIDYHNIRTTFLLGKKNLNNSQLLKEKEVEKDLVQGDFLDNYYNLTLKTMMGLYWASEYCASVTDFFMFVDDDYYVSTKNVLRFLKDPFAYPGTDLDGRETLRDFSADKFCLYAGFVYKSASPIRKYLSKWYIPLKEYPYDEWPPYAAGGAYILSRKSLEKMSFASLLTQQIRFEDIFVGLLAFNVGIQPVSNRRNFVTEKNYDCEEYKEILASHGYSDDQELWKVWYEQALVEKGEKDCSS